MSLRNKIITYISQGKGTYHSKHGHRGSIRMVRRQKTGLRGKSESGASTGVSAGKAARQSRVKS